LVEALASGAHGSPAISLQPLPQVLDVVLQGSPPAHVQVPPQPSLFPHERPVHTGVHVLLPSPPSVIPPSPPQESSAMRLSPEQRYWVPSMQPVCPQAIDSDVPPVALDRTHAHAPPPCPSSEASSPLLLLGSGYDLA
jgi:hypothetical protein